MTNVIHVKPHTRRKPQPTDAFIETTKALAREVISEREWNAFVGNVLAMELEQLPEILADPKFNDLSEDDKRRMKEVW